MSLDAGVVQATVTCACDHQVSIREAAGTAYRRFMILLASKLLDSESPHVNNMVAVSPIRDVTFVDARPDDLRCSQ